MNEEKNQKVLAIILAIAVIVLLGYRMFVGNKNGKSKIDTESIELVTDDNRFYTVAGCVDRYFMYLNGDDTDSLLILLDSKFKNDNGVNSSNIYTFLKKYKDYYGFIAKKMYVQREGKNKYKYYVYGLVETGIEDVSKAREDFYIIVTLDESNITFSVQPYNGEVFNK